MASGISTLGQGEQGRTPGFSTIGYRSSASWRLTCIPWRLDNLAGVQVAGGASTGYLRRFSEYARRTPGWADGWNCGVWRRGRIGGEIFPRGR